MVTRCTAPACDGTAAPGAPVPLCDRHLAVAADFVRERDGVEDVLDTPCIVCGSRTGVRWPSGTTCAVCDWRVGDVPDGELPPPRVDVVYYVRFDDRIKIGTSTNPRQRLGQIWHQELLAFERGGRALERRRHEQFAADRFLGTEWFRVTPTLLAHVDAVARGVDDPWAEHARWTSEALALRG